MSRHSRLYSQIFIGSLLTLGLLVPAMAETRRAPQAKMDAITQSGAGGQGLDSSGKPLPPAAKQEGKAARVDPAKRCDTKCPPPCVGQPARTGYFGPLFDLFEGHPGCQRRDMADMDEVESPSADRPPRLI
ncbi:hypothetical protein [Chitinimonas sp.]|uniref:hypothetical protein n=1 Tax=Chitinimonas sp. TaxID=1934313 RepID=UPI002F952FA8